MYLRAALVVLTFLCGSALVARADATSALIGRVRVSLSTDRSAYASSDQVVLTSTITNISKGSLEIVTGISDAGYTFDPVVTSDTGQVYTAGARIGATVRARSTSLDPGETKTRSASLSAFNMVLPAGHYTVKCRWQIYDDPRGAADVFSNTVGFTISP
jgi:hypothetical protein